MRRLPSLRAALLRPAVFAAVLLAGGLLSATARGASLSLRVRMSDGVTLAATVTGAAPLTARPVIAEFSPYGPGTGNTNDGPAYNYLLVQIRGTGDSDGRFDALGPRTQADVRETLAWACRQPWSDGRLGLNGFSASAITVYNSLHLKLPCVRTAVLKSGTFSLYRDLLYPGAVNNFVPGAGVLALIGGAALAQGPARVGRAPATGLDATIGMIDTGLSDLGHPSLDDFWQARQFRGEAQHLPILMLDGWFDVESRGAFQAYQALRRDGAHLLVIGGHDGAPHGTDGGTGAVQAWFDHYLRGVGNGANRAPRVRLWLPEGSRESYLAGRFARVDARNWPLPGTRWRSLWLSPSGTSSRGLDALLSAAGSLTDAPPPRATVQSYADIPTLPTASDVPNTGFLGPGGLNFADTALPLLTDTALAEPLGLSYVTPPLRSPLTSAGPAALDLTLAGTAPASELWAVISDVWPDGSSHPLSTGRLLSSYPRVVRSRSLRAGGQIVQPFGDFTTPAPTAPGRYRSYQIEFWPIGNVFRTGDRIGLSLVGASGASALGLPALDTVQLGGPNAARLLLPAVGAR